MNERPIECTIVCFGLSLQLFALDTISFINWCDPLWGSSLRIFGNFYKLMFGLEDWPIDVTSYSPFRTQVSIWVIMRPIVNRACYFIKILASSYLGMAGQRD